MTMKRTDAKRKTRKKLTLTKQTLHDLAPKTDKGNAVRGGGRTNSAEGVIRCN